MNSLKINVRGGALYWQGVWGPHKILMTAEKCKKKKKSLKLYMFQTDPQPFPHNERHFIISSLSLSLSLSLSHPASLLGIKRPMGHFAHLRKQFKSINTDEYIITLIKRKKKIIYFMKIKWFFI